MTSQHHEQTPAIGDVRIGEEVRFATPEEFAADSRRMGDRNREALQWAESDGESPRLA